MSGCMYYAEPKEPLHTVLLSNQFLENGQKELLWKIEHLKLGLERNAATSLDTKLMKDLDAEQRPIGTSAWI